MSSRNSRGGFRAYADFSPERVSSNCIRLPGAARGRTSKLLTRTQTLCGSRTREAPANTRVSHSAWTATANYFPFTSKVRPRIRRTSERTTRRNPLVERASDEAADGTRTHDLLHGNQGGKARCRASMRVSRQSECHRIASGYRGFWSRIGHEIARAPATGWLPLLIRRMRLIPSARDARLARKRTVTVPMATCERKVPLRRVRG